MSAPAINKNPYATTDDLESSASKVSRRRVQDSQFHKQVLLIFSLLVGLTYGLTSVLADFVWPDHLFLHLFPSVMIAPIVGLFSVPLAAVITWVQMKVYPVLNRRFRGATQTCFMLVLSTVLVAPLIGLLIFLGTAEVNQVVLSFKGVGGVPEGVAREVASGGLTAKIRRSFIATSTCLIPACISMLLIARHFDAQAKRCENVELESENRNGQAVTP